MDYAGTLANITPPSPKQNIRIQPYLLLSNEKEKGTETKNNNTTKVKAGGEVKWLITPNNVLDLTVNTDFAQADADRQVNNLTRFSVYFPERRQFFLENAGLFGNGLMQQTGFTNSQVIIPFFSRKIGLDETASPIPIDVGGRFVHRTAKRNFGAMVIQQHKNNITPATTYAVIRHAENIGKQNKIGAVFTYAGNQSANGWNKSLTIGADGFFRFNNYLSTQTIISATQGTHQKKGYAAFIQTIYKSNKWVVHHTQSIVTKNYSPAAGFVAQTNLIGTTLEAWPEIQGKWLPKFSRYFEPGFSMEMFHSASTGKLQQLSFTVFPLYSDFNNGGYVGLFITPSYQRLEETFAPLKSSIATGVYRYTRYLIYFGTDPSKKISTTINGETGKYYDGKLNTVKTTITVAPSPHVFLSGSFEWNDIKELGVYKNTHQAVLWNMETRLAINPRLQLTSFVQHNSLYKAINYNIRLAWEYKPLSYLYVVYNKNNYPGLLTPATQQEQTMLIKLSYLKQF